MTTRAEVLELASEAEPILPSVAVVLREYAALLSSVEDGEGIVRELSGFTPGPWETNEAEHDCPYQDVVIRDTKGRGICRIWFDDAPVPDYNAEQSANVRLIKAAPALLARITLDAQEKAALKGQADVLDALNTSQAHEIALLKTKLASVKAERDALKERIWQIRVELGALFTMLPNEVPGLAMEVCERDADRQCLFRAFELAAHKEGA